MEIRIAGAPNTGRTGIHRKLSLPATGAALSLKPARKQLTPVLVQGCILGVLIIKPAQQESRYNLIELLEQVKAGHQANLHLRALGAEEDIRVDLERQAGPAGGSEVLPQAEA